MPVSTPRRVLLAAYFLLLCAVFIVLRLLNLVSAKACNKHFSNALYPFGSWILGVKTKVEDPHGHLQNPNARVLVANHQSTWDTFVFSPAFPGNTLLIGKKELLRIPIWGIFFKLSGNFLIDRENREQALDTMNRVADKMRTQGQSPWFFPEGTRNRYPATQLLPFKRGAFWCAQVAKAPVLPLVAQPYVQRHGIKEITVKILDPMSLNPGEELQHFSERVRQKMQAALNELSASEAYSA